MADNDKASSEPSDSDSQVQDQQQDDKQASDQGQSGKAEEGKQNDQAREQKVPENLKGKDIDDVIKMYGELQKKMGEQSQELHTARQYLSERQIIAQALEKNPELYSQMEKAVAAIQGTDNTKQPDSQRKRDGEAAEPDPRLSELRRSEENRIINEFKTKFGIDKLETEKGQEVIKKVSSELAEMLDPGGSKSIRQILDGVAIDRLPKQLENAYYLANKELLMDRGSLASDQDMASISSISSASNVKSDRGGLTEREQSIASKLGVKPDLYLKQKQAMTEE